MKLWIDCEFNSFKGALISMALVDERMKVWYASLGCENPDPWVAEHVMPHIGIEPLSLMEFQHSLAEFLNQYDSIHIIADWPEDIAHFCNALITGPGERLNAPPLTMEVKRNLDAVSDIPHNAKFDAIAIRNLDLRINR